MSPRTERSPSLPHTGGKTAIVIFILTLIAFVVESQLTQVRVSSYSSLFSISPPLHSLKKSMYKARFNIANRFSFCTSIQHNPPPLKPPSHMLVLL